MGVEVNPGHRNNPVKEFFHSPTLHKVLKVTAVALAALAALAGVIALSVFVAPAFAAIAIPVTIASILFMVVIAKKNPRQDQEDQPAPAQPHRGKRFQLAQMIARGHAEAVTEVVDMQINALDIIEADYKKTSQALLQCYQGYKRDLENQELTEAANKAVELTALVRRLNNSYELAEERGLGCNFAGIENETGLADCLDKIIQKTEEVTSDASILQPQEFVDLKLQAQRFLNKTREF